MLTSAGESNDGPSLQQRVPLMRVHVPTAAGHDAHAFLFHIIKICSSKGVEAFFRRLAHPTGVAWLWDGYFARMRVYQVRHSSIV